MISAAVVALSLNLFCCCPDQAFLRLSIRKGAQRVSRCEADDLTWTSVSSRLVCHTSVSFLLKPHAKNVLFVIKTIEKQEIFSSQVLLVLLFLPSNECTWIVFLFSCCWWRSKARLCRRTTRFPFLFWRDLSRNHLLPHLLPDKSQRYNYSLIRKWQRRHVCLL